MKRYTVTRDGGTVSPHFDTEPEAFAWLLNHQSASVDHATTHEGYAIVAGPEFDDELDAEILADRAEKVHARTEPGTGDFLLMPNGDYKRIAHTWDFRDGSPVSYQPTWRGDGSFYLTEAGTLSYSGGLNEGIDRDRLTDASRRRPGKVWFFHHNISRAHNGVDTFVNFKVWAVAA